MKIPPYFLSDACLRCGREFRDGEVCLVVFGGPDAKYKDVGLVICDDCLQGERLDKIMARSIYVCTTPPAELTWPVYAGSYGIEGFAKVSRLSNGTYRVGLHRGHVEVWSRELVETTGSFAKSHVGEMGYSKDYGIYGRKSLLGDGIVHTEEEIRFVDLSKPEPPADPGAEAALDRFRRFDEKKAEELLIHYEDIFGGAPKLENIRSQKVSAEFWRNLETLEGMFRSGKVGVCEKCPTCQEIMRQGRKSRSVSHSHGFEPAPTKSTGRYSEALDMQVQMLNYWRQPANKALHEYVLAELGMDRGKASLMLDLAVDALAVSEPFYISPSICNLLFDAAKSIPRSWTLSEDVLYTPSGFAWLVAPLEIPGEEGRTVALVWVSLALTSQGRYLLPSPGQPGEKAVALGSFEQMEGLPVPVPMSVAIWKFGANLSEPVEGAYRPEAIERQRYFFATLMSFVHQRILISPRFYADRMARRRAERAASRPSFNEVRVISLRSTERRTGEGEHHDVEWTCQWIVRGHWRNQWCPGQKHYRPKWIAPYLKGPEDKPLREPGRLFAIVR